MHSRFELPGFRSVVESFHTAADLAKPLLPILWIQKFQLYFQKHTNRSSIKNKHRYLWYFSTVLNDFTCQHLSNSKAKQTRNQTQPSNKPTFDLILYKTSQVNAQDISQSTYGQEKNTVPIWSDWSSEFKNPKQSPTNILIHWNLRTKAVLECTCKLSSNGKPAFTIGKLLFNRSRSSDSFHNRP